MTSYPGRATYIIRFTDAKVLVPLMIMAEAMADTQDECGDEDGRAGPLDSVAVKLQRVDREDMYGRPYEARLKLTRSQREALQDALDNCLDESHETRGHGIPDREHDLETEHVYPGEVEIVLAS